MVEEARCYLAYGQFPPGPKIQAAVEQGGERAVVCKPRIFVHGLPTTKIIIIKSLENVAVSYHCLGGSTYAN